MLYNKSVLIIDDEKKLVKSLSITLENLGISTYKAYNGKTGFEIALKTKPKIILLDMRLPDINGLELLKDLKTELPDTVVVIISAYGDVRTAINAAKNGATDFLTKPFDINDIINLIKDVNTLNNNCNDIEILNQLIGESQIIKNLKNNLVRIAKSSTDKILIYGETGTGKSLIARAIHELSNRKNNPFVELNCSTIPTELFEAELFGAEKGSYTGAITRREGLVELANNGTLFLDEISELPLNLQSKFLSFLENKKFRPLGSKNELYANVRIIAATNKDLSDLVEYGEFRADLYYRLNIITVHIPPLRERIEDIPLLCEYFVNHFAFKENTKKIVLTDEVLKIFKNYMWPGNIRELRNLIERLTILYPGETITQQHLPPEFYHTQDNFKHDSQLKAHNSDSILKEKLMTTEYNLILEALKTTNYHKSKAAELLGISRHALKRKLKKYGIS
ncbi:sigma-54-dependent Fis family transcriptional regulator [Deferribacter autotrophicus]|uniref:Sigma-54-dependent Fis family transcriptional regulator n=1 Tax=Deferribacter autotrophicus TaxID=500465 RepID=A0A5A8F4W4_9BACT|nr:sigma-54 dependent transcriptional regulator [Deferribacter autotrophicus]KAA0256858.1 sigma-54-dependent Fis family transcriptional regulator [Deferribacter autotrophicus]